MRCDPVEINFIFVQVKTFPFTMAASSPHPPPHCVSFEFTRRLSFLPARHLPGNCFWLPSFMALSLPREMPFPFLTLPPPAGGRAAKQAEARWAHGHPASLLSRLLGSLSAMARFAPGQPEPLCGEGEGSIRSMARRDTGLSGRKQPCCLFYAPDPLAALRKNSPSWPDSRRGESLGGGQSEPVALLCHPASCPAASSLRLPSRDSPSSAPRGTPAPHTLLTPPVAN